MLLLFLDGFFLRSHNNKLINKLIEELIEELIASLHTNSTKGL